MAPPGLHIFVIFFWNYRFQIVVRALFRSLVFFTATMAAELFAANFIFLIFILRISTNQRRKVASPFALTVKVWLPKRNHKHSRFPEAELPLEERWPDTGRDTGFSLFLWVKRPAHRRRPMHARPLPAALTGGRQVDTVNTYYMILKHEQNYKNRLEWDKIQEQNALQNRKLENTGKQICFPRMSKFLKSGNLLQTGIPDQGG